MKLRVKRRKERINLEEIVKFVLYNFCLFFCLFVVKEVDGMRILIIFNWELGNLGVFVSCDFVVGFFIKI